MKKLLSGIMVSTTLLGGGVVVDQVIDPYTDRGTHYVLSVDSDIQKGETINIQKNSPVVTLNRWGAEEAITITPQLNGVGASTRPFLSKRLEFRSGNKTVFVQPNGTNSVDIDFSLAAIPQSNVFTYTISGADNLDFFYQPPLTPEEVKLEHVRPANVIGSYAVYSKTKKDYKTNGTNYGSGKLFHIYRPQATDALGNSVWGDLDYANGVLTVTIPQTFLDTATYPVIIDPTFGYTSQGASDLSMGGGSLATPQHGEYSLSETGSFTTISAYMKYASSAHDSTMAVYLPDGAAGVPSTRLALSSTVSVNSASYTQYNATITTTNTASGNYWLCDSVLSAGPFAGVVYVAYDTGGTSAVNADSDTCPSPASIGSTGTNKISIWVTYTTGSAFHPQQGDF